VGRVEESRRGSLAEKGKSQRDKKKFPIFTLTLRHSDQIENEREGK
jgi:hypothetical protein